MANAGAADTIVASLASILQAKQVSLLLAQEPQFSPSPLLSSETGPTRWLFPTGSYALGVWQPGDDVDLVLVTDNSRRVFFDYAAEALSIEPADAHHILGYLRISDKIKCLPLEHLRVLAQAGSNIRLHYGSKPRSFEDWAFGASVVPNLGVQSGISRKFGTAAIQLVADAIYVNKLMRRLRCSEAFADTYSQLRAWANSYAIWGSGYGFLDADCLVHMVCAALGSDEGGMSTDTMIQRFFTTFCGLEFSQAIIRVDGRHEQRPDTSENTAMVVLTAQGRNVASGIDTDGARLIQNAITRTAIDPDDGMKSTIHGAFAYYLGHHNYFVTVDAVDTHPRFRPFAAKTRERLINDTVRQVVNSVRRQIHEASERARGLNMHVRVWPPPITFAHPLISTDESSNTRRLTFLIGISQPGESADVGHVAVINEINSRLAELENTIASENSMSPNSTLLDVGIRLINRQDLEFQGVQQVQCQNPLCCPQLAPEPAHEVAPPNSEPAVNTRFRTAKQAMSRLRWDPKRVVSDYEVGWVDRFDGMKWTALLDWGKATEEEDFIPEHRVWQIRRIADDAVVWDRRSKRDDT